MRTVPKEEAMQLAGFSAEVADCYAMFWHDETVGVCGLHRLMYHWTVHVGMDAVGHADRYCYANPILAVNAMAEWDGQGDPRYWHKHPKTGRYVNEFEWQGRKVTIQNGQVTAIVWMENGNEA
jgi:hypothetical protein